MPEALASYPAGSAERNRWVIARRGPKAAVDAGRAHAAFSEEELGPDGQVERVATLLLTNKECAFKCVMCDLWRHTLDERVPAGAIPAQIKRALEELPAAETIKLYNSGSFFDPEAIPPAEYSEIARVLSGFERVIVESHPAFLGRRALDFQALLGARLEVAIGLETAHPEALQKINKRVCLEQFHKTAAFLAQNRIDLRVFLLLDAPFIPAEKSLDWARRSIDEAARAGARVIVVIPTRLDGAMFELAGEGFARRSKIRDLEAALEHGVRLGGRRVFADLWDLQMFSDCAVCYEARWARLHSMNLTQRIPALVECPACGD